MKESKKGFFRFYVALGTLALLALFGSHYYGWGLTRTEKLTGVPKSVRDNPGAYRTHYFGGK